MASWWHRDIIASGKLPLMLCFLAFIVTFVTTRTITRMIRDGRGPFRNQVTSSGVHIHHSVPGIILLVIGAFTSVGGPDSVGWHSFAAVLIGVGTSLVMDEFSMILHLQDVYWSGEGQLSVEAVSLTAACLGLLLAGFSPWGVIGANNIEVTFRLTATGILAVDGALAVVCALKGKYRTALFGLFVPVVGLIGAVRLARPNSIWARHRYRGKRLERATHRAADFDRRWKPVLTDWEDLIGGRPSLPNPASPASAPAQSGAPSSPPAPGQRPLLVLLRIAGLLLAALQPPANSLVEPDHGFTSLAMPLTAMATAVRITPATGVSGCWRNQCNRAARSAARTTPASSSGSRSLSAAPVRRAISPASCCSTAPWAFRYSPCNDGSVPTMARKPSIQLSGSPSWPRGPYRPATTSTRASASGSPAGRAARSAAILAPRKVVGKTIAASLLGK
jgi:hypothetical protein